MISLTVGKYLNLYKLTTPRGCFSILALDHRNNLRRSLNPSNPNSVKGSVLTSLKVDISKELSKYASAILLDPEIGIFPCIFQNTISRNTGVIVSLEATGYTGNITTRKSGILDGWSVQKTKLMGANAVKLLVYYHPKSKTAKEIEELVLKTGKECKKFDIPLILEILTYSIDIDVKRLSCQEKKDIVIESSMRLTELGGDLLKAEFPIDIYSNQNMNDWGVACDELTQKSRIPWVLLSASVDFDSYINQVIISCRNGASGIAAGRAVWKEASLLENSKRARFLMDIASTRMQRLTTLVDAIASPFSECFKPENKNISFSDYESNLD